MVRLVPSLESKFMKRRDLLIFLLNSQSLNGVGDHNSLFAFGILTWSLALFYFSPPLFPFSLIVYNIALKMPCVLINNCKACWNKMSVCKSIRSKQTNAHTHEIPKACSMGSGLINKYVSLGLTKHVNLGSADSSLGLTVSGSKLHKSEDFMSERLRFDTDFPILILLWPQESSLSLPSLRVLVWKVGLMISAPLGSRED